jgi:hypothetical protein
VDGDHGSPQFRFKSPTLLRTFSHHPGQHSQTIDLLGKWRNAQRFRQRSVRAYPTDSTPMCWLRAITGEVLTYLASGKRFTTYVLGTPTLDGQLCWQRWNERPRSGAPTSLCAHEDR